jgi:hypothetical protein
MTAERKSRPVVDLTAACACGTVTLHLAGKVLSMFMCSCEDCQRATGTGHSAIVLALQTSVTVSGETRSFARLANSGATLTRTFCPNCGTPIYAQSSRAADVTMLPVGLFGGTAASWYEPNQLIFARSHRHWDLIDDALPHHQTYREEGPAM